METWEVWLTIRLTAVELLCIFILIAAVLILSAITSAKRDDAKLEKEHEHLREKRTKSNGRLHQ